MKVLLFCLFTLLLCLSAKKRHLVRQDEQATCSPNCKDCLEGTCFECNEGFILNFANNVCEVAPMTCPTNCKNCTTTTTCDECNEYFKLNDQKVCCSEGCLECDRGASLSCKKCAESLIIGKYGNCVNTVCPEGQYFNSEQEFCAHCNFGCAKCNSANQCLACNQTMGTTFNSQGECRCPNGSFLNFQEKICQTCGVDCLKCSRNNYCFQCKEGLVFKKNEGCHSCKPGSYFDANKTRCVDCLGGCLSCTNPNECTVCDQANHFVLNADLGICQCEHGLYPRLTDSFALVCDKCKENCLLCSELTDCYKCSEGFELKNNEQCVVQPTAARKEIRRKHKNQK